MSDLSRRDFIKALSATFGAAFIGQLLAACRNEEVSLTTSAPVATTSQSGTNAPPGAGNPSPVSGPDLVVARNGEPEELVRQALIPYGGMSRFVPQGAHVIIKPNICVAYHTYEYAATTNPWVIGELVRQCLSAGARKVQVMDYPFGGSAEEAYITSGIQEQVNLAGGEMVVMSPMKFVPTDVPGGKDLRALEIYDDVLKADVLINVPIAKHHGSARLTLSMKNWLGVIKSRQLMHLNLGQRIADLSSRVKPTLVVIDAVRMLMDHGPGGGDLNDVKKADTVIVSQDFVAADSYATTLFGLKPEAISYIKAAAEMGLGKSQLKDLRIEEINLAA